MAGPYGAHYCRVAEEANVELAYQSCQARPPKRDSELAGLDSDFKGWLSLLPFNKVFNGTVIAGRDRE
jgi:hypothetical protein